jgi:hypothetical protein
MKQEHNPQVVAHGSVLIIYVLQVSLLSLQPPFAGGLKTKLDAARFYPNRKGVDKKTRKKDQRIQMGDVSADRAQSG